MINWHHSVFAARLTVVMILSLLTLSSALLILPVFSAFTVTIVGPASSTVGTHVRFNATATGGTAPYTFSWNYGDSLDNNSTGLTGFTFHSFGGTGTFTVKVNATDSTNAIASSSTTIIINPAPLRIQPIIISPSSVVTVGDTPSLSASAGGGAPPYSFSWNLGDGTGNLAGGASNPNSLSHTYGSTGTFTIKVNVTDTNAVVASTSATIQVLPLSVLGLDCSYGSSLEGAVFPSSVTASYPYAGSDFDGTLDTSCQATYLADTDAALHPLVSDNPTAVVSPGAGGGLTVDVVAALNTVTKINAFDVNVKFDPKVLNAVIIDQSGLIWGCGNANNCPTGVFVLSFFTTIDNTNGVIHMEQALVGVQESGNSELFRVRFDLVSASTGTPITIFNDLLLNPGVVRHVTQSLVSPGVDTTSIFNVLSGGASLNAVANWTFSPNPEIPGSPIIFTAQASCPGCIGTLSYTWDFSSKDSPDYAYKTQATGSSVTITAPAPVTNRVTLTINDTATPADSIRVTGLLPLAARVSPSVTTLSQGSAGGSWSGQWLGGVTTSTSGYTGIWVFCPGSGTVKTVCSAPVVAFSQSGTGITQTSSASALSYNFAGMYNATLKISDTGETQIGTFPAGNSAVSSFLVNVTGSTPAYTVSVTADDNSPGASTVVTLTAEATYTLSYPGSFRGTLFNYVFNFGDGTPTATVSQNQTGTVQHTFPSSGSFMVKVVAQEAIGPRAVSQILENGYLRIRPLCPSTSSCDFALPSPSPTVGQSVSLTASAAGGSSPYTFTWDFGDGSPTATGSSVSHIYNSSGTFNVTLTITDSTGQVQTVKKTVTINNNSGGGGGGSDLASFLTSPAGLGLIAAAVIIILAAILFLRRRGSKLAPKQLSS